MLQAVTTPVMKSIVLGGLLLAAGLGIAQVVPSDSCAKRLVLHARQQPGAVYLSAWRDGDVVLALDTDQGTLPAITFKSRASGHDGCRWLGVETLTPLDERTYSYAYNEYILECDRDARPYVKTPRTGFVVVRDR